jgi:hypothetical protein
MSENANTALSWLDKTFMPAAGSMSYSGLKPHERAYLQHRIDSGKGGESSNDLHKDAANWARTTKWVDPNSPAAQAANNAIMAKQITDDAASTAAANAAKRGTGITWRGEEFVNTSNNSSITGMAKDPLAGQKGVFEGEGRYDSTAKSAQFEGSKEKAVGEAMAMANDLIEQQRLGMAVTAKSAQFEGPQEKATGEAMAMADDLIEQQRLGMAAGGVIGLGRGGRMRGSSSFGPSGFGSWGGVRGGRMSGSSSFRSWGNDGGPVTGKATMFLGNRAYNANPWSYEVPAGWPAPQQRSMGGIVGMSGGGLAGVGEFPDSFRLSGATNVNLTANAGKGLRDLFEFVAESRSSNHVLDHQRSGSVYA